MTLTLAKHFFGKLFHYARIIETRLSTKREREEKFVKGKRADVFPGMYLKEPQEAARGVPRSRKAAVDNFKREPETWMLRTRA
ncbi:hypothetical protein M0802_013543 [Mischocyttarus mexicanus]|nr:hypothetical protein M0802_013543 [Mischocyttarus mexicanus]